MFQVVPFFPNGNVLYAEIRGEVNHAHPGVEQELCLRHGDPVRRRKEHAVTSIQRGIFGITESEGNMFRAD